MSNKDLFITAAVEGIIDEAVVRAITDHVGLRVNAVYGNQGKDNLRQRLRAYNNAAQYSPWFVLTDLDDEECAPPLRHRLLPEAAPNMCLRIAVREVESWLMADRSRLASFLHVSEARVPVNPEAVPDPKETMVNLARQSRLRAIREDMVPRPGSGRPTGPAYASRLIEFVSDPRRGWRCGRAATRADSLRRCLACLKSLRKRALTGMRKRNAGWSL